MIFLFKKNNGYRVNQKGSALLLIVLFSWLCSASLLVMQYAYISAIKQQDVFEKKMLMSI